MSVNTKKDILFSGIQPTGSLHIGNYLGAVQNWTRLQNEHDSIFCVVDYHAITLPVEGPSLAERSLDLAATLLACGIDPEKATLFLQSHVPEHTELAWIFNTVTPMGDLSRMTQFKDKSARNQKSINAALFTYPVLQTADILLYRASLVPVGEDQVQHIELSREICRKFNARFGDTFPEPKPLLSPTKRIMGLDGQAKMSKSLGNHIALDETSDEIWAKLRVAFTDPARLRLKDPGHPDICNIFALHQTFSPVEEVAEIREECQQAGIGCVACKKRLLTHLDAHLTPIRDRLTALRERPDDVRDVLSTGARRCRALAAETMADVRERVGLLPQGTAPGKP
jgi:tryptophanyl-tRNA synthetase